MSDLFEQTYNPDVLSCLANLSNDEVFTPPDLADQVLDMNDAVYKFRRYEDSSLEYTGINKHEGERVGLFDTTLSEFDYLQMKQEETLRGGAVTDADAGIRAPRRAVRIVDSTSDGKPLTVDAVVTNGGNDWVVASLRKGGFRFVDHRDERGNLWVIGGRAIEDRLKPLFDHESLGLGPLG